MNNIIEKNTQFRKKLFEIYALEPNSLGPSWLTYLYKKSTSPLKSMPFFVIVPFSSVVALGMYVVFGHLSIMLVSVLQYGF